MSNCVVGSGGGMPLGVVTEHCVEGYNHLAHHGDDDDFGLFASGGETIGEGFESGVVSACAQGCHVKNITHGHATPIDTAVSLKLSAVKVVGRETHQGGDLLAIDLAELRQRGDVYTIVDMAVWGWARLAPNVLGEDAWAKFPNLKRLVDEISARPAAQRAAALKDKHQFKTEMDEVAVAAMFPHMKEKVA